MPATVGRRSMPLYGFCLFVLFGLIGCGMRGNNDVSSTPGFSPSPGLGDTTTTPAGQPFQLPAGITAGTVVGALHPLDANNQKILSQPQCGSYTSQPVDTVSLAVGYVDLCVELINSNGAATDVTLPGGLTFVSQQTLIQHGLLAQSTTFTVPPGQKWVLVRLYCLNRTYDGADGRSYSIGPVTDYAPLQEIVGILQDKQIDANETLTVQDAVWQVTNSPGGLTNDMRVTLNGL